MKGALIHMPVGHARGNIVKDKTRVLNNYFLQQSAISKENTNMLEAHQITKIKTNCRPSEISAKISVIIPVKNGGMLLGNLLSKLRSQKRIKNLEIIIIDSESTDNSVKVAYRYGAHVIRIKQKEFNHGKSRNLGASKAQGEFLVFTVQDALPVNNYWLYNMICPFIEFPKISALSCKQLVKPKADIYSQWMADSLSRLLGFRYDSSYSLLGNASLSLWKRLDIKTKRRITFLDNVASVIRKRVFDEIKFNPLNFGEDIDFGKRLLENKHTLGYLASTGVYHWHDRPPFYFLKRHYVGTIIQASILQDTPSYFFTVHGLDWKALTQSLIVLYNLIRISLPPYSKLKSSPLAVINNLANALKRNIQSFSAGHCHLPHNPRNSSNNELEHFLRTLEKSQVDQDKTRIDLAKIFLLENFIERLKLFSRFLCYKFNTLEGREEDFIKSIYKMYAAIAGEAIGAYFLEVKTQNRLTSQLAIINKQLGKGVCYY